MKHLKSILCALALIMIASFALRAQDVNLGETGKSIGLDVARTWMRTYESKGGKVEGHYYGKKMLNELLSHPNIAGVSIFVGLDGAGNEHLIFKPLNELGEVPPSSFAYDAGSTCPPICPPKAVMQLGSAIEEGLAQQMINTFQSKNEGRTFAHSFRADAFNEILAQPDAAGIYFANGMDENSNEHLILVGTKDNGEVMWNGLVYNSGATCAIVCPGYPPQNMANKK